MTIREQLERVRPGAARPPPRKITIGPELRVEPSRPSTSDAALFQLIARGHVRIHIVANTEAGQAADRAARGMSRALAGRSTPQDARGQAIDLTPLATLLARIEERCHPEQIWLFGSRARGDARPWSDWDLLVVLPDDAPESDLDPLLAWQLQKGSGVYADVIPCRASEFREDLGTVNTIFYDVAREGVRIDER